MIEIRDTSTPVVILQSVAWFHHGGLGIARSLGRLGVRVYWMHGPRRMPTDLSRYVHEKVVWDADAPVEEAVESVLNLGRRIGRQCVLIPIDDMSAVFVADQADALRKSYLFPDQPAGLARSLNSKKELHFLCKEAGVPTPEAVFPQSRADVAAFVERAAFPVVMKRIASWLPEHLTQESVTIVHSTQELLDEYKKAEVPGHPNVMLQEYIPGGPESVWMFNGYFGNDSECLAAFTGKKIRQSPPLTGATTLGICLHNQTVEDITRDFMRKIGYRGIVDMGYRYDQRDGQYKLLDVNPRVGSTFRLFVDSDGMDVVRALYLDVTGQPVKRGAVREGRKWMVEQSDLLTSLRYGRLGELTLSQWVRSFGGIEEGAWFARDDPLPLAAMCLAYLGSASDGAKTSLSAAAAHMLGLGG